MHDRSNTFELLVLHFYNQMHAHPRPCSTNNARDTCICMHTMIHTCHQRVKLRRLLPTGSITALYLRLVQVLLKGELIFSFIFLFPPFLFLLLLLFLLRLLHLWLKFVGVYGGRRLQRRPPPNPHPHHTRWIRPCTIQKCHVRLSAINLVEDTIFPLYHVIVFKTTKNKLCIYILVKPCLQWRRSMMHGLMAGCGGGRAVP